MGLKGEKEKEATMEKTASPVKMVRREAQDSLECQVKREYLVYQEKTVFPAYQVRWVASVIRGIEACQAFLVKWDPRAIQGSLASLVSVEEMVL
ncbi:Collagen type IV [Caligus rogercresseyi]|uniref:Collagen type IV n=1 Tax=Caligus rogercresseyi TaxID=217165 RepID=A0A7T8KCH0_CALRO|nr:Collagen type IV [Caligus rogercresseyi]